MERRSSQGIGGARENVAVWQEGAVKEKPVGMAESKKAPLYELIRQILESARTKHAFAGRLSLRLSQRGSLEILNCITEIVPLGIARDRHKWNYGVTVLRFANRIGRW